jgi:hypothetical protein
MAGVCEGGEVESEVENLLARAAKREMTPTASDIFMCMGHASAFLRLPIPVSSLGTSHLSSSANLSSRESGLGIPKEHPL